MIPGLVRKKCFECGAEDLPEYLKKRGNGSYCFRCIDNLVMCVRCGENALYDALQKTRGFCSYCFLKEEFANEEPENRDARYRGGDTRWPKR